MTYQSCTNCEHFKVGNPYITAGYCKRTGAPIYHLIDVCPKMKLSQQK